MCSRNRNQWSGCRSLFCSLQTKIQTPVCDSLSLYWHQAVLFRVYPWKCECLWICQAFPTTVERKKERAPQGRLWHTPQQLPQSTDCCDHNPEARYPPWTFSTHSSSLALSDDFTKKNTWGGIRRKVKSEDSVLMPVLGCWLRWDSLLSWFHPTHREPSPVFLDSISSMVLSWPTLASTALLSPPVKWERGYLRMCRMSVELLDSCTSVFFTLSGPFLDSSWTFWSPCLPWTLEQCLAQ